MKGSLNPPPPQKKLPSESPALLGSTEGATEICKLAALHLSYRLSAATENWNWIGNWNFRFEI